MVCGSLVCLLLIYPGLVRNAKRLSWRLFWRVSLRDLLGQPTAVLLTGLVLTAGLTWRITYSHLHEQVGQPLQGDIENISRELEDTRNRASLAMQKVAYMDGATLGVLTQMRTKWDGVFGLWRDRAINTTELETRAEELLGDTLLALTAVPYDFSKRLNEANPIDVSKYKALPLPDDLVSNDLTETQDDRLRREKDAKWFRIMKAEIGILDQFIAEMSAKRQVVIFETNDGK